MAQEKDNGKANGETPTGTPHLDWLAGHRDRLQQEQARYRVLETRWSWIRLMAFVAGVAAVVLLRHNPLPATGAAVLGFILFAGTIRRYGRWETRRTFVEHTLVVIAESLHAGTRRDRPARAWQRPADPADPSMYMPVAIAAGPTWSLTDQERDDLDLYGPPVGVFGLLNRTSTDAGARRLRDMLDSPCLSPEYIVRRQQAIQWLAGHHEPRLRMMASVVPLRGRSGHLDRLAQLLHQAERPCRSTLSTALRVWSALSGLFVFYALIRIWGGDYAWFRMLVALLVWNSLILFAARRMLSRLRAAVSPWTGLVSALSRLLAVADHADKELPDETQLSELKGHFRQVVTDAHIPSLCAWLEWAALHGMARSLFNVTVFLDLHIAEAVLARVAPGRDVLLNGLSALAELDALCGPACFSAEQPVACYPQVAPGTRLVIEDGRHPLLLEEDVKPNDVRLTSDKRTWVITGPNAAGKSTFLRMVGVNVLLAQIGSAVPARQMSWSPVRLITDVRIRDDLAKNESYFLSEVRRLRRLVLDTEAGAPALGLIDEPFRGTNSQERTAAGIALLEHLMASRNLFLVATHEGLLAEVAAGTLSAENYHFQEHLHDGGILFDYLLRPGPATTRTALRILEREGYPSALLDRARRLLAGGTQAAEPG